jgi:hypothetical protein
MAHVALTHYYDVSGAQLKLVHITFPTLLSTIYNIKSYKL